MDDKKHPALPTLLPLWSTLNVPLLERKHVMTILRKSTHDLPMYIENLTRLSLIKQEYDVIETKRRFVYEYLSTVAIRSVNRETMRTNLRQYRYYVIAGISLIKEARAMTGIPISLPRCRVTPLMDDTHWLRRLRNNYFFELPRFIEFYGHVLCEEEESPLLPDGDGALQTRILNWGIDLLEAHSGRTPDPKVREYLHSLAPNEKICPEMLFRPDLAFTNNIVYIDLNLRLVLGVPYPQNPGEYNLLQEWRDLLDSQPLSLAPTMTISAPLLSPEMTFTYILDEGPRIRTAMTLLEDMTQRKQAPVLIPMRKTTPREHYTISIE
ncbi:hypothetical protein GMRT_12301 [Giardia muris]|uniref:Uncharacterized protein n=1 Tax=Giardia muris TaxID=5742 RepID=A0A4Z1SXP7_GIAMU|nr:hypothetical protein GMRT_12301 [Giardia muris]|eukprot:TNJ30542.1 hypothetical protein GMRT_12301 [Giardia muris]